MNDVPAPSPAANAAPVPKGMMPAQHSAPTATVVEPRGVTIADLLAIIAGVSVVLAAMPAELQGLFASSAWERDRFPDPSARALLVFLLGTWLINAVGIAILPAALWRQARHRRMPYPGEWLAAMLVLASPRWEIEKWASTSIGLMFRRLGWESRSGGDYFAPPWSYNRPADSLIAGGVLFCIAGLLVLRAGRRAPPLLKTFWITLLIIVYLALPAQSGSRLLFDGIVDVPTWNSISWQEFQTTTVDVQLPELVFLPVAVAASFVARSWLVAPRRRWCWTEWAGIVMLVASISLYCIATTHRRVDPPDWQALLVLIAVALALTIPIQWCWKRWWA